MTEALRVATTVATPVSLLALIATLFYYAYSRRAKAEERRTELLPEKERAKATDHFLTRYRIDGKDLPVADRITLIRDEMSKRHQRALVYLLVAAITFIVCFALAIAGSGRGTEGAGSFLGPHSPEEFNAATELPGVEGTFTGTFQGGQKDLTIKTVSAKLAFPRAAEDGSGRYIPTYRAGIAERSDGSFQVLNWSDKVPVHKIVDVGQSISLDPTTMRIPRGGLNSLTGRWIVFEIDISNSKGAPFPGTTYAHSTPFPG